jgi:hypothetical protein
MTRTARPLASRHLKPVRRRQRSPLPSLQPRNISLRSRKMSCLNAIPCLIPPSYSSNPVPGERRLEYAARVSHNGVALPTGTFVQSSKDACITLHHQNENTTIPVFDRLSSVEGHVDISNPHSIIKILVKVRRTRLRPSQICTANT